MFGGRHSTQANHLVFNDSVLFPFLSPLPGREGKVRGRFQHKLLPAP